VRLRGLRPWCASSLVPVCLDVYGYVHLAGTWCTEDPDKPADTICCARRRIRATVRPNDGKWASFWHFIYALSCVFRYRSWAHATRRDATRRDAAQRRCVCPGIIDCRCIQREDTSVECIAHGYCWKRPCELHVRASMACRLEEINRQVVSEPYFRCPLYSVRE